MLRLIYSYQRKHLNELLKEGEGLNITQREIMNKYLDEIVAKEVGVNPQEELNRAYIETRRGLEGLR